jgi:serine/threonine protein kinase
MANVVVNGKNGKYNITNNIIGKGSFSCVYLGTNNDTNVAIKKITLNKINEKVKIKIKEEIEIMFKLNHENIVKIIDTSQDTNSWYIIIEYCNVGTLEKVIEMNKKINKNEIEENTHYYLQQLRNALQYVHTMGFFHRDIKPENILLMTYETNFTNDNFIFLHQQRKIILKLADFGLAKNFTIDDKQMSASICGSPYYMSPEMFKGNGAYSSTVDLWSCGIIMYQILYGIRPFSAKNHVELLGMIKYKSITYSADYHFSNSCMELMNKLLTKDPEFRIDWEHFLNHEWFDVWKNKKNVDTIKNLIEDAFEIIESPKQIEQQLSSSLGPSNLTKMKKMINYPMINYPSSFPKLQHKYNLDGPLSLPTNLNNSRIFQSSSLLKQSMSSHSSNFSDSSTNIFTTCTNVVINRSKPVPIINKI